MSAQAAEPVFPETQQDSLQESSGGYVAGDRIAVGFQYSGSIFQNGHFSLPIDPTSGLCLDGGHPIGAGLNTPYASSVLCLHIAHA
jgi:hypothetical protein